MDTSKPHPARRYAYWLGGKDHFAADRESGDAIERQFPWIRTAVLANRAFLGRAVQVITEQGVRQFLDIGTGLPAPGNTHEVAQRIAPDTRVLYVDNDPIVMVHSRALSVGTAAGRTAYLETDVRRPETILDSPELAATLDLGRPVCLVLMALLHFVHDLPEALSIVRTLLDRLPAGSYLVMSHATNDYISAEQAAKSDEMFDAGLLDVRARSRTELTLFLDGLEVLDPGFAPVSQWRPDDDPATRPTAQQVNMYGVVARKTR